MRIGSLFSGAGGLDLAALELFPEASIAWHSEVDPAAAKVLAYHWPDVPNLGDVTHIDWAAVEPVDVLVGGFPCQDVSAAGKRAGLAEGTRSGLWSHMASAIDVLRPQFVLIENVRGLLSAEAVRNLESGSDDVGASGGSGPVLRALGAVLGDLADLRFDAEWACVRASDIGLCHHRARVFILGYPSRPARGVGKDLEVGGDTAGQPVSAVAGADNGVDARRTPSGVRHLGCPAALVAAGENIALLPTPRVADVTGGHRSRSGSRSDELLLPGVAEAYTAGSLLPTPKTTDAHHSSPADLNRKDPGLRAIDGLLPTPTASDCTGGGQHPDRREGHTRQLVDFALASGTPQWGMYERAIRRQELATRPAPSPTEPNKHGRQRLSAAFAEWMMAWPSGWVTDPAIGLSRNDQLHAIGNGVVPPQAVTAFRQLLAAAPTEGAAS
ncbi:DNA cytosine methyltransferase [Nocardia brasiliensis]|uniref:DNA cytosine methyltransferase n=1 Tax=Nocardia brasiliensis TaxID=37326 RepID=UPI0024574297|nr:DNA (cytosine-5-)-methyltransferase [Nocardia brasiliensis]